MRYLYAIALSVLLFAWGRPGAEPFLNGFDLSSLSIDIDEVMRGGPPRDGIPSIDHPKFVNTADVDYLQPDDIVIGFRHGTVNRAYPTRILIWHEIVNDTIDGLAVSITYCPLCGTGMVFERTFEGQTLSFGVSGLLYHSDVLMYDRESESLWSQLKMAAISGQRLGTPLVWLPSEQMTWSAWKEANPDGQVLSIDTGFRRNYGRQAYASYFESDRTMFPVPRNRDELPDKAWVVGVLVGEQAVAFPVNSLPDGKMTHEVAGRVLTVEYDSARQFVDIRLGDERIPSVLVFWFAWQAFYPDTGLWQAE